MSKYSRFKVVGSMNGETVIYDAPEYRQPGYGEVVEHTGRFWRILNPAGTGNEDVTRDWQKAQRPVNPLVARLEKEYSPNNPRATLYRYQRMLDAGLVERPARGPQPF